MYKQNLKIQVLLSFLPKEQKRIQIFQFESKRLISPKLEPVVSQIEKTCIISYYSQFSTNFKIKIII